MKRIIKYLLGEIECDTVLGEIAPGFFRIPLEPQSSTIASYNNVRTIL